MAGYWYNFRIRNTIFVDIVSLVQMLLSCTVSIEIVIPSVMSSIIMILFSSALFHLTIKLRKKYVKAFWFYLAQNISINFNDIKLL